YIWTPLLKRFGTAPILCSSLPLLALAALLFGCSAGFLSAAFAILACGLVNALTPVVRHCLAESAASGADALDQSSNARLAEQVSIGWFLGCLIGPLITGCLAVLLTPPLALILPTATTAINSSSLSSLSSSLILPPLLPSCLGVGLVFCAAAGAAAAAASSSVGTAGDAPAAPAISLCRQQRQQLQTDDIVDADDIVDDNIAAAAEAELKLPTTTATVSSSSKIPVPLILVTSESQNGTLHVRQASLSASSAEDLSCGGGRGAGSASPAAPGCSRQQQQQQQENSNDDRLNDSIGSDSVELFLTGRVGVSSRGGATAGFALVAEALVNSTNSNLWLSALLGAVAHLSSELGFHSFGGGSMGSARMTKTRLLALLAIFLLSFAIGYQRVLVLAWSATDSELGGLGFETGELTGLLCISAATQLLATVGIAVCGARNMAENLFCRINFDRACSTRPNQRSRHGLQFTGSPVCSNGRW
uniref:Solute carrier family 40 protein n=1 Tax=Macrostomum lignano TaxID=282301 RepID=A0A1I8I6K9_9PLAT